MRNCIISYGISLFFPKPSVLLKQNISQFKLSLQFSVFFFHIKVKAVYIHQTFFCQKFRDGNRYFLFKFDHQSNWESTKKAEYIARNIYIHYNAKSNTSGRIYVLRVRSRSNLAPNQDESVAWDRTSISRIASQHLRPEYLIRRPDSAMRSLSSVTQSVLMVETNSFIDQDEDMNATIIVL